MATNNVQQRPAFFVQVTYKHRLTNEVAAGMFSSASATSGSGENHAWDTCACALGGATSNIQNICGLTQTRSSAHSR